MRRLMIGLPALVLMSMVSCAPMQQAVQVPTVKVDSIRLTSLTVPGIAGLGNGLGLGGLGSGAPTANITLRLNVNNPNGVALRLANIGGSLVIDGQKVGDYALPNINLPARGEAQQDAELSIPVSLNTASAFLKVARGQEVSYRLDGAFTADLGLLGQPTFGPFTLSQGVWKQAAILRF